MSSNSDVHQDLYVRITLEGYTFVQEYRTWSVEGMLKTIHDRHPSATVEQIDHTTYLKELHRATDCD